MNEIKRKIDAGETGMLLIVPEQYSHDAEKKLCEICGDVLSLHAETVSFTRLCSSVLSETGKTGRQILDSSGQILVIYRALESVASNLKVFGLKRMRTEIPEKLLEAVKEFKSLNITPQVLERAATQTSSPLSDKLIDLALLYDAYDALLQVHGGDSAEQLMLLADSIAEGSAGGFGHIYFDGFNDFTSLEMNVIEELLRKDVDITVSLTCDMENPGEIFEIPRKTVGQLKRLAADCGVRQGDSVTVLSDDKTVTLSPCLTFLEKHFFSDDPPKFTGKNGAVTVYKAPSRYVECEYAAYEVWKLVRSGCRWRDIGVMARDWDEYGSVCENIFEKYGIPYFTSGKADIMNRPPLTLIDAALETAVYGWEYKSIFKYLKSGLTDITTDQCAVLENYVLKWQIRGFLWDKTWIMPPLGYGRAKDGDDKQLAEINEIRLKVIKPLTDLRDGLKGESSAEVKLRALYEFLEEIKLPERLAEKSEVFKNRGEKRFASEYDQLWDITVKAIDQMYTILGDEKLNAAEFHKLFTLAISQNDVGVIPVSLDRTVLGGMMMSRRRDLKHLIILGATDDNMPALGNSTGALSDNERNTLRKLGTDIPAGLEERLYREMNMLYSTLTLPSNRLIVIYSTNEGQRPSFVVKRLCDMFDIPESSLSEDEYMTAAEIPYLEFLYCIKKQQNGTQTPGLSGRAAQQLYGKDFRLSATRVDRYYLCPHKHFLYNGLRLEPRVSAGFGAAEAGNCMHFILDGVFSEIKAGDGFKNIGEEFCLKLTSKYINRYVHDILLDFEGKSKRFEYLFRRYQADMEHVVLDMVNELSNSNFEPFDLELDMSELSAGERGFIDRVDGFERDGKLYLRIIDYKTRKKAYSFELTDILNGRDMQMLIYLFALEKHGKARYGKSVEPAGVLYVPARDVILNISRNSSEAEIRAKRTGEMRRSGLILNDTAVLNAMENGTEKYYLPVKATKDGTYTGDSLVSPEQIKILSGHVGRMMQNAKDNISSGDTGYLPYYKNERDNACFFCEYQPVCGFDEELGDKRRYAGKKDTEAVWKALEVVES